MYFTPSLTCYKSNILADTFKRLLQSSLMLYKTPTAGNFLVILMKTLQMIPFHCLLSLAILCLTYINHTGSFSYTVFTILKWHHYICKQNQKFSVISLCFYMKSYWILYCELTLHTDFLVAIITNRLQLKTLSYSARYLISIHILKT